MSYILGLDLSLTSTGVAKIDAAARTYYTEVIKPPAKATGVDRIDGIVRMTKYASDHAFYVAVEGPSYGSMAGQKGQHERAGLWWCVVRELHLFGIKPAIIPPSSLKMYATGVGNAGKDAVLLATARRFPAFIGGNDEADALWLAAMAADHLGMPLVTMPAAHRKALDGVTWPEVA